jgi:hypothetical protein
MSYFSYKGAPENKYGALWLTVMLDMACYGLEAYLT